MIQSMDYNDMRVGVGVEYNTLNHCSGLFEVGVAFERELFFRDGPTFDLNTTVYLRGGLAY